MGGWLGELSLFSSFFGDSAFVSVGFLSWPFFLGWRSCLIWDIKTPFPRRIRGFPGSKSGGTSSAV